MRLLRFRADGFGPLRREYVFDPDRATIVVNENERGKSSLLFGIAAALYGLDADKRTHRVLSPLERWRPWDGGSYGVALELECQGERMVVRRDFERGTTEVWDARGQEVTADFREGKEDYPIGKKLLGLDAAEFEKCCFVRQHDLDHVVPGEERLRRMASLQARLESAADTHGGDTNASEAIRVLEDALKRYPCTELDFTGTVEVAIQRLEAKRALLEAELATRENELAGIRNPIQDLARLGEEERATRRSLARLDSVRRRALIAELEQKIASQRESRAELARLEREGAELSSSAHLAANAETEFGKTVARMEEVERSLGSLEARRREEQARARELLEAEAQSLEAYAAVGPETADRFVAVAAEMRRLAEEEARLPSGAEPSEAQSSAADQARRQELERRFAPLEGERRRMLKVHADSALAFQTELAALQQSLTEGTETLRDVDAARQARRLPGWFLFALGVSALTAGLVVMGIGGVVQLWVGLLVGGALLAGVGLGLVTSGGRLRGEEREAALRQLTDSQRRIHRLRGERAEREADLAEFGRGLGYRDPAELARDWHEFRRLAEDHNPVARAREGRERLEQRRHQALEDARGLLDRVGGGPPDPAHLERIAAGIRHLAAVRQRLAELDKSWSWMDDEKRNLEATLAGLKETAVATLQAAGLAFDPVRSWSEHALELGEKLKARARHAVLELELIPRTRSRLMTDEALEELEAQLAALASVPGEREEAGDAGTPFEIEKESARHREELELILRKRSDLRLQVDEICRRHRGEIPEKLAQLARCERALERARRFKSAVEMAAATIQEIAQDTHRRWAEFLNQRVTRLLDSIGSRVEGVRFAEDLDFSVRLRSGQQMSRGKALVQLSAGARDQIHLAARLAISEYLSRGQQPLPLLLDDVFATSDDERARAGMRLLIEHFGRQHQVILVTCHRRRHEALAELDPDLYAARVQWLEAGTRSPMVE